MIGNQFLEVPLIILYVYGTQEMLTTLWMNIKNTEKINKFLVDHKRTV